MKTTEPGREAGRLGLTWLDSIMYQIRIQHGGFFFRGGGGLEGNDNGLAFYMKAKKWV